MTCIWPADTTCCPEWDTYDVQLRAVALVSASDVLWRLTGRIFSGVPMEDAFTPEEMDTLIDAGYTPDCSTIIRPCRKHDPCDTCGMVTNGAGWAYGTGAFIPYLDGGQWFNAVCGRCGDTCQCGADVDQIELPGPVAQINTVWVDGEVFNDWALYNSNILIRTDGEQWPACQDLAADLTAEGTWGVDYQRGIPVPADGRRAAGILACEFARLCAGDKRCRIPAQVTQVTREGVSYTIDPNEFFTVGLTGIPQVDLFISSVNPGHNRRPSGVYTPDTVTRKPWMRRQPGEVTP